jgi:hypothetical protein
MLLDRVTSVRTLCVALLLCTVYGQSPHAGEEGAPGGSSIADLWRPLHPFEVFTADTSGVPLARLRPGSVVTDVRPPVRPFDSDRLIELRTSDSPWVQLVSDDEPEEVDQTDFNRASSESF